MFPWQRQVLTLEIDAARQCLNKGLETCVAENMKAYIYKSKEMPLVNDINKAAIPWGYSIEKYN